MRVHLARIGSGDYTDLPADEFEQLALSDRFGEHEVTADPDGADIVLFTQCHMVDWRLRAIRDHPLSKRCWDKVVVYDERDRPWRSFPGVYVSMPSQSFNPESQQAWGYLRTPVGSGPTGEPDLLFSFVGSATAPCRQPLFKLRHPDAVIEEVRNFMFWDDRARGFDNQRARFQDVLARSRFVLCPRGRGTSSFRLYETLAAGRVPVILSDDWVAPRGPDWTACAIRWPEGETDGLIELLEQRNQDWPAMSAAAVQAHREFFAPEATFHRIIDLCRALREVGCVPPPRLRISRRSLVAAFRERRDASA